MKIGVLGYFGKDDNVLNGQTIKTKSFVLGIEKYTSHLIMRIDSCGWIRNPFRLLKSIDRAFKECDCVIMFPAQNGVRVFAPLLAYYKRKFRTKVFYNVIGGWLPEFLKGKSSLRKALSFFDGIWVETTTMRRLLTEHGFQNIAVVPNFKDLRVLNEMELIYPDGEPYKLCTFSRVMKEKGVETAVNAVASVNEKCGRTVYTLDIYGPVDEQQTEWFEGLKRKFPSYIHYCGCVEPQKSVETLKYYFALLFPTHFYTEGVPGTIIDAYSAGIPVVASRWQNFADVVDDGATGIGYDFEGENALERVLMQTVHCPDRMNIMKVKCLEKSRLFTPEAVITTIMQQFDH